MDRLGAALCTILRGRVKESRLYASFRLSDMGGGSKFHDRGWETVSVWDIMHQASSFKLMDVIARILPKLPLLCITVGCAYDL